MKATTYTINCARTGDTYIRNEENLFDDLFDILEYNCERKWCRQETSMKGRFDGGSIDDAYLGEAEGVRQILAWVLTPGFHAEKTDAQVEKLDGLLKRIQEDERNGDSRWVSKRDYPSL